MAQYANLKDFFQHEHIKLIKDAVSNHLKDDSQITEAVIRSMVCTADDAKYNTEFDLGVSVKTVEVEESVTLSFIVTVRGNLEQRFGDIKVVRVRRVTSDMFPKDNILSQFILPDIPEGEVERIGSDLYKFYSKDNIFEDSSISIERLVSKGMLYFSPLPDNCLGRIILSEADVEVIHNVETEYGIAPRKETILAPFGTILLNYNRYAVGLDGTLRVTVAHELVHLQFHNRFLKLLQLLGEEKVDMLSSADTDTLTDIQQALSIAEWQADILAMPLAIPALTVDAAIQEIADDPSTHYENYGDRMQACVIKFARFYGVSPYVAKERLRQLGYDNVDGTCLEYEENGTKNQPAPFYFKPGTLKENETFVIDSGNYERLLREKSEFSELITSRIFVYTGYVVCLYDAKYVKPAVNNGQISYELTDYAREHADECCLFYTLSSSHIISNYTYYGQKYLCNVTGSVNDEYSYDENGQLIIYRKIQTIIDRRKRDAEIYDSITSKGINSFSTALTHIMDVTPLTKKIVAERIGCDEKTIQNYRNSQTPDSIEKVLLCCLGCQTGPKVSRFLIEKSVGGIPDVGLKRTAYEFLLENTNATLAIWNAVLKEFHLPPIYM